MILLFAAELYAQQCKPFPRGHVYDMESGAALQGLRVEAVKFDREVRTVFEAVTNPHGYFEFPNLDQPGWHVVIKTKEPWRSTRQELDCNKVNIYVPNPDGRVKPCKLSLSGHVYEHESDEPMPGHVVRATNGANIVTAVADRSGHFEFLNLTPGDWWITSDMSGFKTAGAPPFATLHPDSVCLNRNLYLRRHGPRERLEEAVESIPGYAVALFQLVKEALGSNRQR